MDPKSEIDWLAAIAASQDETAFSSLFARYAPRIKGYMMRQGVDATTAEELAQEAMTTVWRKAGMYSSDKGNPSTWIFTIARNLRIDRVRRERVFQPLPEGHNETASDDEPADVALVREERYAALRQALETLPADQLEIVTLSYMDGLSHSEVADHLDLPLGTVKSRMRLAYSKLWPLLEG
jgi:RNA polymerase sigma-70 factor (ECF subfamily)